MLGIPNARLFIHNLVAEKKLSGADAIVHGAIECGLLQPEDLSHIESQMGAEISTQFCGCMTNARSIVSNFFERRVNSERADALEGCWKTILHRCENYIPSSSKSNSDAKPERCSLCAHHAPVVFDYMLQEIRRYG